MLKLEQLVLPGIWLGDPRFLVWASNDPVLEVVRTRRLAMEGCAKLKRARIVLNHGAFFAYIRTRSIGKTDARNTGWPKIKC